MEEKNSYCIYMTFTSYSCALHVFPKIFYLTFMLLSSILLFLSMALFLAHLSTACSRGAFRVVQCASVNNFFKHLLIPNCWANLDQAVQECSLAGPL